MKKMILLVGFAFLFVSSEALALQVSCKQNTNSLFTYYVDIDTSSGMIKLSERTDSKDYDITEGPYVKTVDPVSGKITYFLQYLSTQPENKSLENYPKGFETVKMMALIELDGQYFFRNENIRDGIPCQP